MTKRILPPRRKRMRRHARLATAPRWLVSYGGKHVVRGYARWYGVDLLCAIKELRLLGVQVPHEYEAQIRDTTEDDAFPHEFSDDVDDGWF